MQVLKALRNKKFFVSLFLILPSLFFSIATTSKETSSVSFLAPQSSILFEIPLYNYGAEKNIETVCHEWIEENSFYIEFLNDFFKSNSSLENDIDGVEEAFNGLYKNYFYLIGLVYHMVEQGNEGEKYIDKGEVKFSYLQAALKAAVAYLILVKKKSFSKSTLDQKRSEFILKSLDQLLIAIVDEGFEPRESVYQHKKIRRMVRESGARNSLIDLFSFVDKEPFKELLALKKIDTTQLKNKDPNMRKKTQRKLRQQKKRKTQVVRKEEKIVDRMINKVDPIYNNMPQMFLDPTPFTIKESSYFIDPPEEGFQGDLDYDAFIDNRLNDSFYRSFFDPSSGLLSRDQVIDRAEEVSKIAERVEIFVRHAHYFLQNNKINFEIEDEGKFFDVPIAAIYVAGSSLWALPGTKPGDIDVTVVLDSEEKIGDKDRLNRLNIAAIESRIKSAFPDEEFQFSDITISKTKIKTMDLAILSTGYLKDSEHINSQMRLMALKGGALPIYGYDVVGEWTPNHEEMLKNVWSLYRQSEELKVEGDYVKASKRLIEAALIANMASEKFNQLYNQHRGHSLESIDENLIVTIAQNMKKLMDKPSERVEFMRRLVRLEEEIGELVENRTKYELQIFGMKVLDGVFQEMLSLNKIESKKRGPGIEDSL